MFSIWVTVAMTWSLKAISEIFLLLLAIRRYRRFGPNPNPESSCCWKENRYIAPKAGSASDSAACAGSRPSSACTRCTSTKPADTAAWSAFDDSRIHSSENAACLRAQNVHIRDRQVVARNRDVQIVFHREPDCVFE